MGRPTTESINRLEEALDDAWLGIDRYGDELFNPLEDMPDRCHEEPHIYMLWLLSNPEYFAFFCKEILNIQLLPFQCVILHEMWVRKFPILIGSRGLGKCVNGNTLIFTDNGIKKIGDVVGWNVKEKTKIYDIPNILNEKMNFNNVEYGWNNGYGETIQITTSQGFELEGTPEHPIRVVRNNRLEWVELKDIKINDYIPIDRSEEWFPNTEQIDKDLAYLFGLMVGDGGYTVRGRFSFTSNDQSSHDTVKELWSRFFGKEYSQSEKRKITGTVFSTEVWDEWFSKWGFNSPVCSLKTFPTSILSAQKEAVASFIRGLMDTDGSATKSFLGIEYCSKSKDLVQTLQFVLTRFGIISKVKKRLNKKYQRYYYYLYILGNQAKLFSERIGFGLERKQKILESHLQKKLNTNLDIVPKELVTDYLAKNNLLSKISSAKNISYDKLKRLVVDNGLDDIIKSHYFYDKISRIESTQCQTFDVHCKDDHSFISNGIISHNSFLLALYAMLRLIFMPGRKVVITGAGFRQSKIIFEYMEKIWYGSPLLRDLVGNTNSDRNGPTHGNDMWRFIINESQAVALPIGSGEKIRGQRAHDILVDEFAVGDPEIFEHVISGFASVSAEPVNNVKLIARQEFARKNKIILPSDDADSYKANQIVLSGTAYYSFNHFYKYWRKNQAIVNSRGDPRKLIELGIVDDLNWKDYSVIRLPYDMLPKGFMEDSIISRSRSSMHSALFAMEFLAEFGDDSNGFFRRAMLEKCVAEHSVLFEGLSSKNYVISVDPASESDNFCIVVLEVEKFVRKIAYCWTTTRKQYKEELKKGIAKEDDFYNYTCRKILTLVRKFNTIGIAIDTQGGGHAIIDRLHAAGIIDKSAGEVPLWKFIDPEKPDEDDGEDGRHIIEPVNFADSEWLSAANHGMKLDFENKSLLFPKFDMLTFAELDLSDGVQSTDLMEEAILEIEELKNELSSIVMTQTPSGKDRWDTPDQKTAGAKKGRMRKDRYSALLMGNALAKKLTEDKRGPEFGGTGGFAGSYKVEEGSPVLFTGGALAKRLNDLYAGM